MSMNEPLYSRATIVAVVTAVLGVLTSFGLGLSAEQSASIVTLVAVLSPFVLAYMARKKVTPVANPKAADGTPLVKEVEAHETETSNDSSHSTG